MAGWDGMAGGREAFPELSTRPIEIFDRRQRGLADTEASASGAEEEARLVVVGCRGVRHGGLPLDGGEDRDGG